MSKFLIYDSIVNDNIVFLINLSIYDKSTFMDFYGKIDYQQIKYMRIY